MASKIVIPFDFNPSLTDVLTAAYTVPSGKYAKITVSDFGYVNLGNFSTSNANGTTTFTDSQIFMQLNSESIAMAQQYYFQVTISDTGGSSGTTNFTYVANFPTHFTPEIASNCTTVAAGATSGAANVLINGLIGSSILNASTATPFDAIRFAQSGGDFFTGTSTFRTKIIARSNSISFWCKSGSVITCPSGMRYTVEEYNVIS